MIRVVTLVGVSVIAIAAAACGGGNNNNEGPAPTPPAAPAAPAAPKPSTTVTLLEPTDGAMGGHIDMFRWSPVQGADGYVIRIVAVTGNRVVWESEPMAATEARLPATVALEPEVHTWSVTARKGSTALATSATQRFT
ncbi:MAG TPA: hypothetical protein VFZ38_15110, partial [Vicinamibacterales bacterium]